MSNHSAVLDEVIESAPQQETTAAHAILSAFRKAAALTCRVVRERQQEAWARVHFPADAAQEGVGLAASQLSPLSTSAHTR
jgi:hypothetical protein